MVRKGGYQLLELGIDLPLATPVTINGIYDKVTYMNFEIRKTIILSDYTVDGIPRADSPVRFVKEALDGGGFVLTATIASDKNPNADQMFFYVMVIGEDDVVEVNQYRANIVAQ